MTVSTKTRCIIWARAAGRCQYTGCNHLLIGDLIAGNEGGNFGLIAHIIADKTEGPRGDAIRSPLLADDPNNLMLLCYTHHKLVDVDELDTHPEERLLAIKAEHEKRVAIVTDIKEERASHALIYAAKIGGNEAVAFSGIKSAMMPATYPADGRSIDIEIIGSQFQDHEEVYWKFQQENLQREFQLKIRERLDKREIKHLSVFGLAPQPLLIELGRLLCDIIPATVYQLHREPKGWAWPSEGPDIAFQVDRPQEVNAGPVALKLALSATITNDRIKASLGDEAQIWTVTTPAPHNDIMKRPESLSVFRTIIRKLFNDMKAAYGEDTAINIFPAVPVSAAVEIGRVWMPKADLPLKIYDQNRTVGGFIPTLRIG